MPSVWFGIRSLASKRPARMVSRWPLDRPGFAPRRLRQGAGSHEGTAAVQVWSRKFQAWMLGICAGRPCAQPERQGQCPGPFVPCVTLLTTGFPRRCACLKRASVLSFPEFQGGAEGGEAFAA